MNISNFYCALIIDQSRRQAFAGSTLEGNAFLTQENSKLSESFPSVLLLSVIPNCDLKVKTAINMHESSSYVNFIQVQTGSLDC